MSWNGVYRKCLTQFVLRTRYTYVLLVLSTQNLYLAPFEIGSELYFSSFLATFQKTLGTSESDSSITRRYHKHKLQNWKCQLNLTDNTDLCSFHPQVESKSWISSFSSYGVISQKLNFFSYLKMIHWSETATHYSNKISPFCKIISKTNALLDKMSKTTFSRPIRH